MGVVRGDTIELGCLGRLLFVWCAVRVKVSLGMQGVNCGEARDRNLAGMRSGLLGRYWRVYIAAHALGSLLSILLLAS